MKIQLVTLLTFSLSIASFAATSATESLNIRLAGQFPFLDSNSRMNLVTALNGQESSECLQLSSEVIEEALSLEIDSEQAGLVKLALTSDCE